MTDVEIRARWEFGPEHRDHTGGRHSGRHTAQNRGAPGRHHWNEMDERVTEFPAYKEWADAYLNHGGVVLGARRPPPSLGVAARALREGYPDHALARYAPPPVPAVHIWTEADTKLADILKVVRKRKGRPEFPTMWSDTYPLHLDHTPTGGFGPFVPDDPGQPDQLTRPDAAAAARTAQIDCFLTGPRTPSEIERPDTLWMRYLSWFDRCLVLPVERLAHKLYRLPRQLYESLK